MTTLVTHVEEVEEDDECMRKLVTCAEENDKEAGEDQWMRKLVVTCVEEVEKDQ